MDAVFETCDFAVMHAYPSTRPGRHRQPIPSSCRSSARSRPRSPGRPVLAEEFGACTALPGQPTQTLEWEVNGVKRRQLMLAEDELASYLEEVLPRLVEVGAIGALPWCFADYDESLWKRPPLDHAWHERYFGLVRPDGSLKPHAEVIKRFAASAPTVREPSSRARIAITGREYYSDPKRNLVELYREFREKPR